MINQRVEGSSKGTLRRIVFVVGIPLISACLTFMSLYTFARARPVQSAVVIVPPEVVAKQEVVVPTVQPLSPPVRLQITSINIDTIIQPVGLTADNNMDIDDSIDKVAWYQLGSKPGEKGSAVIAGHYGWKNGQASIFNDLHTLAAGSEVITYDQAGNATAFIVQSIRKYNPEADATSVFKSTDDKAHLNLITCGGVWVNATDSYSDRLVVFTDLK